MFAHRWKLTFDNLLFNIYQPRVFYSTPFEMYVKWKAVAAAVLCAVYREFIFLFEPLSFAPLSSPFIGLYVFVYLSSHLFILPLQLYAMNLN